MSTPTSGKFRGPVPVRDKPREGERTRGAADALHTKIAVSLQALDPQQCEGARAARHDRTRLPPRQQRRQLPAIAGHDRSR